MEALHFHASRVRLLLNLRDQSGVAVVEIAVSSSLGGVETASRGGFAEHAGGRLLHLGVYVGCESRVGGDGKGNVVRCAFAVGPVVGVSGDVDALGDYNTGSDGDCGL